MVDQDLVRHLRAVLAKAEGGEVLFYVGSATIITAHNEAVALAGGFVTPAVENIDPAATITADHLAAVPAAAAALHPASRKAAYTKTLEALGVSLAELTGIENPVSVIS